MTCICGRHAENGTSTERVRKLLDRTSCHCHRGKCFRKCASSLTEIMKFLLTFWSLEKPAQDAYDSNLVVGRATKVDKFVSLGLNMFPSCFDLRSMRW